MAKFDDSAKMPSNVDEHLSLFDRFAIYTSEHVSKAWFFGSCAVLVLIWVPTIWLWPSINGWTLVINTFTSTITFLLVALLQNTETRGERDATQAQRTC
jgi:low affinity Fe/Cu permease